MKRLIVFLFFSNFVLTASAQVGIGTSVPKARFHVVKGNVLFSNDEYTYAPFTDSIPVSGQGIRMMWGAIKGAFRAGYSDFNQWDEANVGSHSAAFGYANIASGPESMSHGAFCISSGRRSTSFGFFAKATGIGSTANGDYVTASGANSVAIGSYISTNEKSGSFILGDYSVGPVTNVELNNQMIMRFIGGYKLLTDKNGLTGVQIPPGGNSWSTISDIRRKENFMQIDGESFLQKIAKFNLVSWNYIGQSPSEFRHYGPMAQEFYQAFGHDDYGNIGNDTTINQADFDGVNLIAIQALEKRTTDLKSQNETLSQRIQKLEAVILELQKEKSVIGKK